MERSSEWFFRMQIAVIAFSFVGMTASWMANERAQEGCFFALCFIAAIAAYYSVAREGSEDAASIERFEVWLSEALESRAFRTAAWLVLIAAWAALLMGLLPWFSSDFARFMAACIAVLAGVLELLICPAMLFSRLERRAEKRSS